MTSGAKILGKIAAWSYRTLRALVVIVIVLAVALPAALYVGLSLPSVQEMLRREIESIASNELGAKLEIGDMGLRPFNRATLRRVNLTLEGDTIAKADVIGAGVSIYDMIVNRRISMSYAEIIGLDVRIKRDSASAPLNIQPIIDRLNKNKDDEKSTKVNLRISTVVMRRVALSYDVGNEMPAAGVFDPNHIGVKDLQADISIPSMKDGDIRVDLRRLSLKERSGLSITNLQGYLSAVGGDISWRDVELSMPGTLIKIAPQRINLIGETLRAQSFDDVGPEVNIMPGSHLTLSSFAPLLPMLASIDNTIELAMDSRLTRKALTIGSLRLADRGGLVTVDIREAKINNYRHSEDLQYTLGDVTAKVDLARVQQQRLPERLGFALPTVAEFVSVNATGAGSLLHGSGRVITAVDDGSGELTLRYDRSSLTMPLNIVATFNADEMDFGSITGNPEFGRLNADLQANATFSRSGMKADGSINVNSFNFKGVTVSNGYANATFADRTLNATFDLRSDAGDIEAEFSGSDKPGNEFVSFDISADNIDLDRLAQKQDGRGLKISSRVKADLAGHLPDRADGYVRFDGTRLNDLEGKTLKIDSIVVMTSCSEAPRTIAIRSGLISGEMQGEFALANLPMLVKDLLVGPFPEFDNIEVSDYVYDNYDPTNDSVDDGRNVFDFGFTINQTEALARFFNLPMSAVYPINIGGHVDGISQTANLQIDAPYIRSGDAKLIEDTSLDVWLDGVNRHDRLELITSVPTANGFMNLTAKGDAANSRVDTDLSWRIDRRQRYDGKISFGLYPWRDSITDSFMTTITLKPSEMAFNDSVWNISPAIINVADFSRIDISGLEASRAAQHVRIDGTVSELVTDTLKVDLRNFDLDYLFETLAIDNVDLGGKATGRVEASALLSPAPRILTDGIDVEGISYNNCVIGDALVLSYWDLDNEAVHIDGAITGEKDKLTRILVDIYALRDSLDLRIDADSVPVGFMHPFLEAFATDITGRASGSIHLWGTFHDVELTGDLFAKDFSMRLKPTNTVLTTTDSVIMRPGRIVLPGITVKDIYGHTARLDGLLTHDYLRDARFEFKVSDAKNFLVFDQTPHDNPDWYGRVFVDGGALIQGVPGSTSVSVDATTAPSSTFTFVLSDMEVADEYTFLTFRDATDQNSIPASLVDENMDLVNRIRKLASQSDTASDDSKFSLELKVGITPQAEINLVMDPVSGDRIRSHGSGNVRLLYSTDDPDIRMWGRYTLENGTYNFTLQDIIIKDFAINQGSSITFSGDPMDARLDIEAAYSLNANLSDLDESFLEDRDLNRTNVPVQAILRVSGDLEDPDISFDLAFPTLTSDIYRKVRSIISTDEMLNRQIIYLLALNRFYTPDYMNATKGSELFSVASSTISSQLSSMLGRLTDKVAIAPTLRSDRGDFSDLQIDVALSSSLLNNRLLLNGNFGYRDKSLNTNQFIGDFDIQYLLNRAGTLRLKAYSHYNDGNYYLRTAATTQGIGLMFRRDFDNLLPSFLKKRSTEVNPADSVTTIILNGPEM